MCTRRRLSLREWTRFRGAKADVLLALLVAALAEPSRAADDAADFELQTLRGHVVFLAEALPPAVGKSVVPEAQDRILALKTGDGQLVPLLEDIRGRAFRRDKRLRKPEVELLVRRYANSPVVQVIRVFEVIDGDLLELDYWCDICAIAMYELKECECCQGPIELRRRKTE